VGQIALVLSTAIFMCLLLPNFSLALPPLLMEELESRQVGWRVSEWGSGLMWLGGLRVGVRVWGSGTVLEGTRLVLCTLCYDQEADLDTSTECGLSAQSPCLYYCL
jgi:hypothetical protein